MPVFRTVAGLRFERQPLKRNLDVAWRTVHDGVFYTVARAPVFYPHHFVLYRRERGASSRDIDGHLWHTLPPVALDDALELATRHITGTPPVGPDPVDALADAVREVAATMRGDHLPGLAHDTCHKVGGLTVRVRWQARLDWPDAGAGRDPHAVEGTVLELAHYADHRADKADEDGHRPDGEQPGRYWWALEPGRPDPRPYRIAELRDGELEAALTVLLRTCLR